MSYDPTFERGFFEAVNERPEPDGNLVEFHYEAVFQKAESDKANRPIYKDEEYIRITSPGGRNVVDRPASERDKHRYASLYAKFKAGEATPVNGTPIKEWPFLSVSKIKELHAQNIYTVEQIAAIPDSHLSNLGLHGVELRAKAKDFLDKATKDAPLAELRDENVKLKRELSEVKEQVALLTEALQKSPKKRGVIVEDLSNGA